MPSMSICKTVLRVGRPPENNQPQHKEDPNYLSSANGIVLGTGWQATYQLQRSSKADEAHGTLERTSERGVWVYSDHSSHGTLLNNKIEIHNDAVVVHHGDQLQLGQMEIVLCLETSTFSTPPDAQHVDLIDHIGPLRETTAAKLARPAASMSKAQQKKQRLPHIDTLNLDQVVRKVSAAIVEAPFDDAAVPISSTKWMLNQPQLIFFGQENDNVAAEANTPSSLPPLEYSSSPMVSPSSIKTRTRHQSFPESPRNSSTVPSPALRTPSGRLTARRDDLRIQVSKKMAAAAPRVSRNSIMPEVVHRPLTSQAPASPVALRIDRCG